MTNPTGAFDGAMASDPRGYALAIVFPDRQAGTP